MPGYGTAKSAIWSFTCRRRTGEAASSDSTTTLRPPSRSDRGRRGNSRSTGDLGPALGDPSSCCCALAASGLQMEPRGTSRTEQAGTTAGCVVHAFGEAATAPPRALLLLLPPPRKPLAASAALAVRLSMRPSMEPFAAAARGDVCRARCTTRLAAAALAASGRASRRCSMTSGLCRREGVGTAALSVRCRLALLADVAALVFEDTGARFCPAVRADALLTCLPRGEGGPLPGGLLLLRLAEAEREVVGLTETEERLRPPPFMGSSRAGREAERLPTARDTVPTGFLLEALGISCGLVGVTSAGLLCTVRGRAFGFARTRFATVLAAALGLAAYLVADAPRIATGLPFFAGLFCFPAALPLLADPATTAAMPRPPETSGLLLPALPLRFTGLAGASSSEESDSSEPDSPLLLASESLSESLPSSELDASASRIILRTRGAASFMKRLIWMATLSFWHSQNPACTPTAIHDFVAKLVDSAQL